MLCLLALVSYTIPQFCKNKQDLYSKVPSIYIDLYTLLIIYYVVYYSLLCIARHITWLLPAIFKEYLYY